MKLTAYVMDGHTIDIRPAPFSREWMDNTENRHAYRCLPLNIANALGWEIRCPGDLSARWNGEKGLDAVSVQFHVLGAHAPAISHFGHGILTFHIPCLFRTDPGINLLAMGPLNLPKDGIQALAGVIETDWSPYTFTMNWKFTRPGTVLFEKDEPICQVFPIDLTALEKTAVSLKPLSSNPQLKKEFETWSESRNKFNADLKQPRSGAVEVGWQKSYYRGQNPSGEKVECEHRTKLKLKVFKE